MRPLIGIPGFTSRRPGYAERLCVKREYCDAVHAAGGAPVLVPLLDDDLTLMDIYGRLDGLLLAGGGDIEPHHFGQTRQARLTQLDVPRDRTELFLTRRAVEDALPMMAVCRGVQMLNVALGGTLYQDISTQIPNALQHKYPSTCQRSFLAHEVLVQPATRLSAILGNGRIPVNSFHHQSPWRIAAGLRACAHAPDGVIEALESADDRFLLGVQWHPEDLYGSDMRMLRLFEAFVQAAARRSTGK